MYKRADRRDPRSVRASCCEMTAMQCVSCPPDGIRVGRTRPGGAVFCYGSGTDANANASCDEASERVMASLCMPCKVLDKTTEVPEQSRSSGINGPVSWISCVSCVCPGFYILCPREGKKKLGLAYWRYGPVLWRLLVDPVFSMLSCQRDAEEMGGRDD